MLIHKMLNVSCSCKAHQQISGFNFNGAICSLCVFLHRFGFGNTRDQFKNSAENFKTI